MSKAIESHVIELRRLIRTGTEQANHMWDFGDGTTSNLENPSHIYTSPGTYTVTLTEENFCGITDPVVKTICIEEDLLPLFNLDVNDGCSPLEVAAVNTTDESNSCVTPTYLWEVAYTPASCGTVASWNFTNGTDETTANPSFQFNSAGTYEITMTATNGCGDFATSQIVNSREARQSNKKRSTVLLTYLLA